MTDAERQADERHFDEVIKQFPELTERQVEVLRRAVLERLEQQRMLAALEDPELVALRKIDAAMSKLCIESGLDPYEDVELPPLDEETQRMMDAELDNAVRLLTPGAH